jgi:circadian clock protein KaiB
MSRLIFRIYVAGMNPRNRELVATFTNACAAKLIPNQYEVEVIDIIKYPSEAEQNKILATPTIIRVKPIPGKRTIGDFKEMAKAVLALDFLTDDLINFKHHGKI